MCGLEWDLIAVEIVGPGRYRGARLFIGGLALALRIVAADLSKVAMPGHHR
jgi:hypothetical protein